jgi:8-oxo-dGTP diphosphatase
VHKGRWTLPGGGLDFGERPADAVVREVHEETGLDERVEELIDADAELYRETGHGAPYEAHAVRFVYRVTVLGGTLGVVEVAGSTDDARWWPMSGLPELTPMAERTLRTGRLNG